MHAMQPSQKVEQLAFPASAYMLFIILMVYSNCSRSILSVSSAGNLPLAEITIYS